MITSRSTMLLPDTEQRIARRIGLSVEDFRNFYQPLLDKRLKREGQDSRRLDSIQGGPFELKC
ncbi:MAG: hypothetical protein H6999_01725 [Hahellaceae bacterium]|nr:hypothetical protein [Hahellaceae bacterium]MCP5168470.1 hypothetical protein [Hahellaceae bacterium]